MNLKKKDFNEKSNEFDIKDEEEIDIFSENSILKDDMKLKESTKETITRHIKKSKGDNTKMEENTKATAKINFSEIYDYKTITLEQMQDFIEKYHPEDKEEFKKNAIEFVKVKDSSFLRPVYRHMKARKYFCEKYMPELLPKKKAKKSESLLNW